MRLLLRVTGQSASTSYQQRRERVAIRKVAIVTSGVITREHRQGCSPDTSLRKPNYSDRGQFESARERSKIDAANPSKQNDDA
jgi:hypothetical protein